MPTIDVELEIGTLKCARCRADLDHETFETDFQNRILLTIAPCEDCLQEARREAQEGA